MASAAKRSRSTARQLEELVDLLLLNKNLALSKFSGPMGAEKNENMWAQMAVEISKYGPPKTSSQLKTTWRDLKSKVRTKNAKVRKSLTATGNKDVAPALTNMEHKVLDIIGRESSEGLGDDESGILGQESVVAEPQHCSQYVHEVGEFEVDVHEAMEPERVAVASGVQAVIRNLEEIYSTPQMANRENLIEMPIPAQGTPQQKTTPKSFKEMDSVANQYAVLQAENNKINLEIATVLKEAVAHFKKNDEERNAILRERNEIEREKNRLTRLQLEMCLRNRDELRDYNQEEDS